MARRLNLSLPQLRRIADFNAERLAAEVRGDADEVARLYAAVDTVVAEAQVDALGWTEPTDEPINDIEAPECECAAVIAIKRRRCKKCGRVWLSAEFLAS